MNIDVDSLVSMSDAAADFLRIARLVDEKGTAVILHNNVPRYVLMDYNLLRDNTIADDVGLEIAASDILDKHMKAFRELAK